MNFIQLRTEIEIAKAKITAFYENPDTKFDNIFEFAQAHSLAITFKYPEVKQNQAMFIVMSAINDYAKETL